MADNGAGSQIDSVTVARFKVAGFYQRGDHKIVPAPTDLFSTTLRILGGPSVYTIEPSR